MATVRFVGSFRGLSGKSSMTLRFSEPVSVEVLVQRVVENLPKMKNELIDPGSGRPRRNMLVLVNEREIGALSGFETVLNDEDEVVLIPVVHGG